MIKQASAAERRQFGRRWSQVQGWICIEGRPKLPCAVQNLSDGGAQLCVNGGGKIPGHFVLTVEALKLRIGCVKVRDRDGVLGVSFVTDEELANAQALALSPPSTYELLLAEASAEHQREIERAQDSLPPPTRLVAAG